MANKFVFDFFDENSTIEQVGIKGMNLNRMTALGLPVPSGFTISSEVTKKFFNEERLPDSVLSEIWRGLKDVESQFGAGFGDFDKPLLLAVRVSPSARMKGLSRAILNVGINDEIASSIVKNSKSKTFAWEIYRRFILDYSVTVGRVKEDKLLETEKEIRKNYAEYADEDVLQKIIDEWKLMFKKSTGQVFPQDIKTQLINAISACIKSWNSEKSKNYRVRNNISDDVGCAIVVQAMVFGNYNTSSGVGNAHSRNLTTGENEIEGVYLRKEQDSCMLELKHTFTLEQMKDVMKPTYLIIEDILKNLENENKDVMSINYCLQDEKLWVISMWEAEQTPEARARSVTEMAINQIITKKQAISLVDSKSLQYLMQPKFKKVDENSIKEMGKGRSAFPGCACGRLALSVDKAIEFNYNDEPVVLVVKDVTALDAEGLSVINGLVTLSGDGMLSYASMYSKSKGLPCVVNCKGLSINKAEHMLKCGGLTVAEGEYVSMNAGTGKVYYGKLEVDTPQVLNSVGTLVGWALTENKIPVYADADSYPQILRGYEMQARGVGLVRTENMFFAKNRIKYLQQFLLSSSDKIKENALDKLSDEQVKEYVKIFAASVGKVVNIRLIDTLLHKMLPSNKQELNELAIKLGISNEELKADYTNFIQSDPQMGMRGCRLLVLYPELIDMQVGAICDAMYIVNKKTKQMPRVNIIVPLVSMVAELEYVAKEMKATIRFNENKYEVDFGIKIGCMLETPRSCLCADLLASHCEFLCIGANDLTELTFGISRDDCAKFLNVYYEDSLMYSNPFVALDINGVAELIEVAVSRARMKKPNIPIWMFGDQNTNPVAIELALKTNINFLSCAPIKIPSVILAQAQAKIKNEKKNTD